MTSHSIPERRPWLFVAAIGCALVVLALVVLALVLLDKPHFGWLVGTWFLQVIMSGVMVGSVVLLVSAWKLPIRNSWRGYTLMAWALVALTSPAFGLLFLVPWGLLVVTLPVVIAIFIHLFR
jgi:MFS family permease